MRQLRIEFGGQGLFRSILEPGDEGPYEVLDDRCDDSVVLGVFVGVETWKRLRVAPLDALIDVLADAPDPDELETTSGQFQENDLVETSESFKDSPLWGGRVVSADAEWVWVNWPRGDGTRCHEPHGLRKICKLGPQKDMCVLHGHDMARDPSATECEDCGYRYLRGLRDELRAALGLGPGADGAEMLLEVLRLQADRAEMVSWRALADSRNRFTEEAARAALKPDGT